MKQHLEDFITDLFRSYGNHLKTDSHQNPSKNSNHIACNTLDKNDKINTHIKIEMTKTI